MFDMTIFCLVKLYRSKKKILHYTSNESQHNFVLQCTMSLYGSCDNGPVINYFV